VGAFGHIPVACDAGRISVPRLFKGLKIHTERNLPAAHGFLTRFLPVTLHAEGLRSIGPLIGVDIGIPVAIQAVPLFSIQNRGHDDRIVGPRLRGDQKNTGKN